ncbi:MAG: hypothetical protein IKO73_09455 [Bacteroidaceae bacterium]|nr:hypothetical protein [Bacteroidaceae bacterium]
MTQILQPRVMKNGNNRYFPVTHVDYVVYDKERRLSAKDVFEQIVPVALTYEELVGLRTAGHLTQGQTYRITDYVTTTVAAGTQSAGHPFDVIVVALGNNVLSEEAWAILHDGDTYFQNCKLQAWKLKYCLDNDTTRFAWANAQNGKGVIYWMRDEFGNECPYDFKNIMFARYKITALTGTATDLVNQYLGFSDIQNSSMVYPSGATLSTTAVYRYTFDYLSGTTSKDTSIYQMSQSAIRVHDNEIKTYFVDKKQQLNNITIGGTSFSDCYGNVYETQNRNWAIAANTYGNHVGTNGFNNSVGNGFGSNTVGQYFQNNTVGNWFNNNSVGYSFQNNTVGNWFNNNSVGNNCYYNTVGNDFRYNSVGNNCYYNTVGNGFGSNTVGQYFSYNSVGQSFHDNTVGYSFQYNSVGNSCSSNTIADNVTGANFLDGITGKNIAPATLDTFDYDYGSWIEGDEDEDGDTLVSGFEGGYFEIAFADSEQHTCHLVVAARHAGGTEVLFDQDITTESDGTYRLEDLSAEWDECKGSMCCNSVEAKWTDDNITQRQSDYSSY